MSLLQTPAIFTEDLSPEEWQHKVDQMLNRAEATQQYEMGRLNPVDYEQALRENGIADPRMLWELWENGHILIGV